MGELGTILVVEDDRPTRVGLTQLLEEEGYEVIAAADGLLGKRALGERLVDLVVSDVAMPGLDGFELVEWLRATPDLADIPVILWSAHGETERKVCGLDVGADDYLTKPVDPEELLAKVRAHLRRGTRSRELLLAAIVDPLTGVRNRRGIIELLEAELARAERTGQRLAVFMVDVDRFKEINDTRGHHAGDEVLKLVATGLKNAVRPYDTVGRFGGDEFVVVASGLTAEHLHAMQGRLAEAADGIELSVGAATALRDDSIDDLLARSDDAMYREKKRRTGVSRPPPGLTPDPS